MFPRVTAILVVHHGGERLERTLAALRSQQRQPDATIVVLLEADGSAVDQVRAIEPSHVIQLQTRVPFGEAVRQAGPRATPWLSEVGGDWLVDLVGTPAPPSPTFDGVAKATPARVVLTLADGSVHVAERSTPVGATGDPSRDDHASLVRDKWLSVGGEEKVADLALSPTQGSDQATDPPD